MEQNDYNPFIDEFISRIFSPMPRRLYTIEKSASLISDATPPFYSVFETVVYSGGRGKGLGTEATSI